MNMAVTPDRAAIRSAIEAMTPEFANLVAEIGDEGWKTKSGIPSYTCGQLAWHLAAATGFLAGETAKAREGKALDPPAFVRPILYKLSEFRVRVASRKATPASVLADFDNGTRKLLAVLDSFDDDTLRSSATRMGETLTIAALLHKPMEHLTEHSAHIRAGLRAA
jgi:hypothetical protein